MHLFERKHIEFDRYCFDAQKFDNNDNHLNPNTSSSPLNLEDFAKNLYLNNLENAIIHRMIQESGINAIYTRCIENIFKGNALMGIVRKTIQ